MNHLILRFSEDQPQPRGSKRAFIRLSLQCSESNEVDHNLTSAILLIDDDKESHEKYLKLALLFKESGVPVPEIYSSLELPDKYMILMEDCGRESLYDLFLREGFKGVRRYYLQALELLPRIWAINPSLEVPSFHPKVIKWEVDYFVDNLLQRYLGVPAWFTGHLRDISHSFFNLILEKETLIHRDFQSQNLLVKDGALKVIDFQSAHLSSPLYDLASLLEDPYVELPTRFKEETMRLMEKALNLRGFPEAYKVASLHRLMQASGAYVKLALSDGKWYFLQYLRKALPRIVDLTYSFDPALKPLRRALKKFLVV